MAVVVFGTAMTSHWCTKSSLLLPYSLHRRAAAVYQPSRQLMCYISEFSCNVPIPVGGPYERDVVTPWVQRHQSVHSLVKLASNYRDLAVTPTMSTVAEPLESGGMQSRFLDCSLGMTGSCSPFIPFWSRLMFSDWLTTARDSNLSASSPEML